MPAPAPTAATNAERLVFLDWARICAFGLLVLYHVGMYYVSWTWHIKSAQPVTEIEPLMRLVSPWRLDLLFLISGAATAFMLARAGASGVLLGTRARRLLIPLAFGMLVIVPPQSYFEVVEKYGYTGDFLAFMGLYLTGSRDFCDAGGCLLLPTWNHLWFLPYLFAYTFVLWALLRVRPHALDRMAHHVPRVLGGARLFVVPIAFLALTAIALRPHFPVTHAFGDDWFAHAQFLAMFLGGAVLARARSVWSFMRDVRWLALGLALASWALLVSGMLPARDAAWPAGVLRPLVYSTLQWCAIVAVVGFAFRHLTRDNAARRYLTDAVFPVYILHQTFTILLARALAPAHLAPALEASVLVVGTFALSFATYEAVRRVQWLRPLFGLKRDGGEKTSTRITRTGRINADKTNDSFLLIRVIRAIRVDNLFQQSPNRSRPEQNGRV